MSKGKEMAKVITRKLNVGDRFKLPENKFEVYEVVGIKGDYLIYKNVGSNEEFQMVRGFGQTVDLVDESADYQKKRFKEPYYMYKESAKKITEEEIRKNDFLGIIKDYRKNINSHLDYIERLVKKGEMITSTKDKSEAQVLGTVFDAELLRYNLAVQNKTLTESFIIQDSDSNNNPVYFHYGKYTGYDWGFDKKIATKFSTKEAAERMIEKMRQEGMLINSMKVIEEAKSADNLKVMDKVWYSASGKGDDIEKIGIQGTILNRSANTIKVGNQKMHGKDIPHNMAEYRISDKHWWKIDEGRIAKGYENLDADEKARHLLSHPSSKYMNDLKSENITERAIRKAVKEMLGQPDKRDPQFITDVNEGCIKESAFYVKFSLDGKSSKYYVYNNGKHGFTDDKSKATKFSTKEEAEKSFKKNPYYDAFNMKYFDIVSEEGEAPAIANTTAEVANPELPLKLKESKYDVISVPGLHGFCISKGNKSVIDDGNGKPLVFDDIDRAKEYIKTLSEDDEALENSIKYQTSVAGGIGTDAENAESAQEHDDEVSLIKEHRPFRKFIKESK